MRSNLGDVLAVALLGVAPTHPTHMVASEIQAGLLQVVLPEYVPRN
jgi:hypothetical protein